MKKNGTKLKVRIHWYDEQHTTINKSETTTWTYEKKSTQNIIIIFCHWIVYLCAIVFAYSFHRLELCTLQRMCYLSVRLGSIQFSGCSARHTNKCDLIVEKMNILTSGLLSYLILTLQTFDNLIDATQFLVGFFLSS